MEVGNIVLSSVKSLFPLQRNPFRLLLFLEWLLLGMVVLTMMVPNPINRFALPSPLVIGIVAVFGLLGLRVPRRQLSYKLLYTGFEFGLVFLLVTLSADQIGLFPLLYLIVAIRSCAMFQPRGRMVVAGLTFMSFLLTMFFWMHPPAHLHKPPGGTPDTMALFALKLNATLTFGLALMFVLFLVNALLIERQSREQLASANEQLRQYALRIENQATLQERNRIAREIHDSLGHLLTAQSIQLENALLFLPPQAEKTQSFLAEARQLGSSALQEVRQSVATLRSDPLRGHPITLAIEHIIKRFAQTVGITPVVDIDTRSLLPTEISTAIYRIIQEAFTNIAKHASATAVSLRVWEKPDGIYILIEDNGHGFDPDQNTTGFGLRGMRERTAVLGGQFTITSQPGAGCQIAVVIPLSGNAL